MVRRTSPSSDLCASPHPAADSPLSPALDWAWKPVLLLVLLVLLAYAPAICNGSFHWDDDINITANPLVQSGDGLRTIWFRPGADYQYAPVFSSSLWIERRIWGNQPQGYILVNVLLHALNAVLLWKLLRQLSIPWSWLTVLIFALHPVCVESVAWISERKNVLSTAFCLAGMMAYVRFDGLDGTEARAEMPRQWKYYALAFILFLGALLSKTVTCTFPAVVLLIIWWKRGRLRGRDMAPTLPFFAAGIGIGLVALRIETARSGARGAEFHRSLIEQCLIAGRALWFYVGKLFWPNPLLTHYPRWDVDPHAAWQYLFPLAALAVIILTWLLRNRIGRGACTALLCFAGILAPALGFFPVNFMRFSYVADHFQYLASIGIVALFVGACHSIWSHANDGIPSRSSSWLLMVPLVLGITTWHQTCFYRDEQTLWSHTVRHNPSAWLARYNLGCALDQQGKTDEAIKQYRECIRLMPGFADAYNNLGLLLRLQGHTEEAIANYQESLRFRPDRAETENNLGVALASLGRTVEAIAHYKAAMALRPDFDAPCLNLGVVLAGSGRHPEAITEYRQALRLNPNLAEAYYKLGISLDALGDTSESIRQYREALRLRPGWGLAANRLAWILATCPNPQFRDGKEAVRLAGEAVKASPSPQTLDTLAAAYAEAGQFDRAGQSIQRAIDETPAADTNELGRTLQARARLYQERQPYRDDRGR